MEEFNIYSEDEFELVERELTYIFNKQLPFPTQQLIEEFCSLAVYFDFNLSLLRKSWSC